MSTNYGLTSGGFILPSLNDITEETKQSLRQQFGENFNTGSNSAAEKFSSILNEREYQLWLLMAAVYSAQTEQGAEGIYLDDLLSKRGVYRLGQTRGTGTVEMTVDSTVPYNTIYPAEDYQIDSGNYEFASDTQVAGNIVAQVIRTPDLRVGTYRLQIQNLADSSVVSLNHNLTSLSSANVTAFFGVIKQFIVENTILSNSDRILIDSVEGAIYIGYNTDKIMIGLSSRVDFRTNPLVGNKTISMDVRSVDPGYISRDAHTVQSISPNPAGFVALDNMTAFIDGSDVESDNEYKVRAATTVKEGRATRPSILSALLNKVEGVEKARIYSNSTGVTNTIGIPPYKYMAVVYGGATVDISRILYEYQALSNCSYGTTFYDITTEDDQIERIWHTKGVSRQVEVRVRYRGRALSLSEEGAISEGIAGVINTLIIGGVIYNVQLGGEVLRPVTPGRFTQVIVEVKDKGAPDSSYTTADVSAGVTEVFSLALEDVEFSQII